MARNPKRLPRTTRHFERTLRAFAAGLARSLRTGLARRDLEKCKPSENDPEKLKQWLECWELARPVFLRPGVVLGFITTVAAFFGVFLQSRFSEVTAKLAELQVEESRQKLEETEAQEITARDNVVALKKEAEEQRQNKNETWNQLASMKGLLNQVRETCPPCQAIVDEIFTSLDITEKLFSNLPWCPAKRSPDKHTSGRLRIATWNIATLHRDIGGRIFANSAARAPIDYERIRCYSRLMDADIIAVQEIDGEEALRRVFDTDVYDLHMSGRNAHQNTGFAFKKGLDVTIQPDFEELDVGDVRHGTRIDVSHNGKTIKLMSIHLKAGCFSNSSSSSSRACIKLMDQVRILEGWIDDAAGDSDAFIVLGDFNRRLATSGDRVWAELDDGDPPNADLVAATENMPTSCRNGQFTEFIDHIVLDRRAAQWFDSSSFRHVTYRPEDEGVWDLISDHCPVVVDLWVK